ncbi:hypothetical protein DXX93_09055 [Thalassotalea euphylliae]|uniref:Lipoprotein n=1 Tax=Thalassotalea euphylliae TaxID=1655234 RepID=A0A3E0TQ99_9GAMM|nr:hypothetical protein [Thalassotalea euphylliae]REL26709.1 hypothetical protein DXX93_09055 [Thalassotalea euphylliae]
MKNFSRSSKAIKIFTSVAVAAAALVFLSSCKLTSAKHQFAAEQYFAAKAQQAIRDKQWQQAEIYANARQSVNPSQDGQSERQTINAHRSQAIASLTSQLTQKNTNQVEILRSLLTIEPSNSDYFQQLRSLVTKQQMARLARKHHRREIAWQAQFDSLAKTQTAATNKAKNKGQSKAVNAEVAVKSAAPIAGNQATAKPFDNKRWQRTFATLIEQGQLANAANILIAQSHSAANQNTNTQTFIAEKRSALVEALYQKGQIVFATSINEAIKLWQLCVELDQQYQKAKIKLMMAYKVQKNFNEIE